MKWQIPPSDGAPVMSCLFPFFPDTQSCEEEALVPPSPQRELGARRPLLWKGGRTDFPDSGGRDPTLQSGSASPAPPPPSPSAPTRQQRGLFRPRGLPYRKVSSISLMVVSFSTTRKLGWRFLLSSPMPPSRKPVTVSSSPITAISFPLPAILADWRGSAATTASRRSPASAELRLFGRAPTLQACAVPPFRPQNMRINSKTASSGMRLRHKERPASRDYDFQRAARHRGFTLTLQIVPSTNV